MYLNNPHCSKPFLSTSGDYWHIQFWYQSEDGKRVPKKISGELNGVKFRVKKAGKVVEVNKAERKRDAQQLINDLNTLLETHYFNPQTREFISLNKADKSLVYYMQDLINNPQVPKEDSTKTIYQSELNVFTKYLKEKGLMGVTLKDVPKQLFIDFLNQYKNINTRNGYVRFFKKVFNHTIDHLDIAIKSPLKTVQTVKAPDSDSNKPYTEAQMDALLRVAKNQSEEFYILMLMVFYTLRRPSEILQLRYKDFNLNEGTVYFSAEITKTDKRQTCHLPEFLVQYLKSTVHVDTLKMDYFLGNVGKVGKSYKLSLFAPYQTPYHCYQSMFKTKPYQSVIEKGQHTVYSFKHSGVIKMKDDGYSNGQIMSYTGHTDESTLGIYARTHKAELRKRTDNVLIAD